MSFLDVKFHDYVWKKVIARESIGAHIMYFVLRTRRSSFALSAPSVSIFPNMHILG